MSVVRSGGQYRVNLTEGEEVNFSCPSVDVLFKSVAMEAGRNASAGLLTGMGRDGAAGLLAIRVAGGRTLAQDETTSVVYGMPCAAHQLGAAEIVAPLEKIPALLVGALRKR
jgi:two-component system chemotaxis response regulator CheB